MIVGILVALLSFHVGFLLGHYFGFGIGQAEAQVWVWKNDKQ